MEEEKVVESEAQSTNNQTGAAPTPSQNSFWTDMNNCSVCKNNLSGLDPKLLLCLHTFCKSCILATSDSNGNYKCPTCHEVSPANTIIDNRLVTQTENADSSGSHGEDKQSCMACEEDTPASSYCVDCAEWLCEQCVQAHKRVRITKDHVFESKDNIEPSAVSQQAQHKAMFCPVHKHELLKLFCETCDQLTCRDCQLLEHKGHKYSFVHEAATSYKNFLQQLLQKITEKKTYIENAKALINKRNKEIIDRETKVTDEVKKYMMTMIAEISKRGKKIVQELNSVCSAKKNQLGQKNQEILALSMRLDHCLKYTEFIINHGDNQALLHSKKLLVDQLRNTLRTRCEVPNPNHVVDIRFAYDTNFKNQIEKLGMVIVDKVPFRPPNLGDLNLKRSPTLTPEERNLLLQKMGRGAAATAQMSQRGASPFNIRNRSPYPGPQPTSTQPSPGLRIPYGSRNGGHYMPPPYGHNQVRPMQPPPPSTAAGQQLVNLAHMQQQRMMMRQQQEHARQQPTSTFNSRTPIVIEPEPMTPPAQMQRYPEQTTPPLQVAKQSPVGPEPMVRNGTLQMSEERNQSRPSSSDSNVPTSTVKQESNYRQQSTSCSFSNGNSLSEASVDRSNQPSGMHELNISPDPASYFPDIRNENNSSTSNNLSSSELNAAAENAVSLANNIGRRSSDSLTPPLSADFNVHDSIIDQVMTTNPPPAPSTPGKVMSQSSRGDDPSEDWCAVCHNGGDLLCCDNCPKVFHLQCHVPALSSSPRYALINGVWQCNLCVKDEDLILEKPDPREDVPAVGSKRKLPTGLTDKEIRVCERILLELYSHESSVPFHEPVPKSVPNYYRIITQPMEFNRIKSKLSRQHFNHYQSIDDFYADVMLVFSNCATYNAAESEVGQAGITVKLYFEKLMGLFLPYFEPRCVTPASDGSDYNIQKPRNKRKRRPEDIQRIEDSPNLDSPVPPETSQEPNNDEQEPVSNQ